MSLWSLVVEEVQRDKAVQLHDGRTMRARFPIQPSRPPGRGTDAGFSSTGSRPLTENGDTMGFLK